MSPGRTGGRRPPQRILWRRGAAAVVVGFTVSRVAFALAGVTFDAEPLHGAFQLLELTELRDHLWRSIAHLHAQPPLFNLFVGVLAQVPESWLRPLFHVVFLGFGLALALCLYAMLARFVRVSVAVALTLVFVVSPSVVLFENWLQYDYPVTLLTSLAALALMRYEEGHDPRRAAIFVVVLAALVLTRSMFHVVWLAAWVVALLVHRRSADWRRVAAVTALPVIVVGAVHLHRLVKWGEPSVSSSLGMSMAKVTTFQLDEDERRALVENGTLSPLALVEPLRPVGEYEHVVPRRPPTGVPVLDDEVKVWTDGSTRVNYHNVNYIDISRGYMHDVGATLRARPDAYLRGIANAVSSFFHPPSDFFTLVANRNRISSYERLYNTTVYGVIGGGKGEDRYPDVQQQFRARPGRTAWVAVAAYAIAIAAGSWWLWRHRRRDEGDGIFLVVAFLWSTILYLALVGNLLEVGENHRFRLYTDPLVVVLLTALVMNRRRPAPPSGRSARAATTSGEPLEDAYGAHLRRLTMR